MHSPASARFATTDLPPPARPASPPPPVLPEQPGSPPFCRRAEWPAVQFAAVFAAQFAAVFAGERNGRPAVDIPEPTRRCLVQCLVAGGLGQDLFVGGIGLGLGAVAAEYPVQPLRPAAFRNLRRHLCRRRAKRNRAPFARPSGQKRPSSFRNLARRHSGTSPEAGVPTSGGSRKLPISHSSQTPAPISASPVVARGRRAADRRRCVAPS